jgi:hypothetical protein
LCQKAQINKWSDTVVFGMPEICEAYELIRKHAISARRTESGGL